MDSDRLLLSMISKSLLLGTDPVLADILTDENIMHSQFAKNALRFISDIDFDENLHCNEEDEEIYRMLGSANQWDARFISGMMMGILMALEGDLTNPFDNKNELGHLYRLLNARLLEMTIEE